MPLNAMTFKHGGPSGKGSVCLLPTCSLLKSLGVTFLWSAISKNSSNVADSPSSLKAYLVVISWSKYGRLIKFPTSPRSTNISSCLGKISQPP